MGHPFDAHYIEVAAEHQAPRRGRRSDAREQIGSARERLVHFGAKSPVVEHAAQERNAFHLAGGAGRQARIPRVDPYECARECARVADWNRWLAHVSGTPSSRGFSACDSSITATI